MDTLARSKEAWSINSIYELWGRNRCIVGFGHVCHFTDLVFYRVLLASDEGSDSKLAPEV